MTPYEVAVRAREILRESWGQTPFRIGQVCTTISVAEAADIPGHKFPLQAHNVVLTYIERDLGIAGLPQVWRWNDTPGRTKEEVLDLMDRVIVKLAPTMDLEKPSRRIVVEPIETPQPQEIPQEAPVPVEVPEREKVPG